MKAIILAAGMGTRLGKYTANRPKGMLNFAGKSLIEWQIDLYKKAGIDEVVVVTGYKAELIDFKGVVKVHNFLFSTTNMVSSLMCAREFLQGDVLVSYADLFMSEYLLNSAMKEKNEVNVVVDLEWQSYWQARYGKVDYDTEGLQLNNNLIKILGKPDEDPENIDARYVGLIKFSSNGIKKFISVYDEILSNESDDKWRYSKNFNNAYMTDMIQEMIDRGVPVKAVPVHNGWLEFDTVSDYELACKWEKEHSIDRFIDFPNHSG